MNPHFAALLVPFLAANLHASQPNLVVILADDLGYRDVGFNGCKDIPTPHIDSIASEGVRCTSAYVTFSVCAPSRAGLMTGRYPQRFGFEHNTRWLPGDPGEGIALSETTLADALGKAGYHSGIIGKWHLGAHPDLLPLKRGFDEFYGIPGGGSRYLVGEHTISDPAKAKNEADSYRLWMLRGDIPEKPGKYLTDAFSDEAVGFVKRNKDKPFFLYLAYNAPHGPLQATEKYLNRFKGIADPKRRTYAAMVSALDDGVGRLLAEIKANGLEEDTIVFFLSDNGGPTENASNNFPLRGHKSSVWEGGFRVPFAVKWPSKLPKGKTYGKPVSSLDIFATIAAASGAKADPSRPLDGVDLVPFLTGKETAPAHDTIYLRKIQQHAFAVRGGAHKLVIPAKGEKPLLFDLDKDIGEKEDISGSEPTILADLEKRRAAWNSGLTDPVFGPGITGPPAEKPKWKKKK
ncbi:sulfatase-like hydrolase/transferase [Akkermansiaceae bacterium]|nr:sulfatase-like hydrolase/transferase [Akkermansiaceae bacterium]